VLVRCGSWALMRVCSCGRWDSCCLHSTTAAALVQLRFAAVGRSQSCLGLEGVAKPLGAGWLTAMKQVGQVEEEQYLRGDVEAALLVALKVPVTLLAVDLEAEAPCTPLPRFGPNSSSQARSSSCQRVTTRKTDPSADRGCRKG